MKANPEKCHLMVSSTDGQVTATVGDTQIANSHKEKLLGITIDTKLSFTDHVSTICSKASHKLNALARVAPYMSTEKRRAFVSSQFGYCPFIWLLDVT